MSSPRPRSIDIHAHFLPGAVAHDDVVQIGPFTSRPIPPGLAQLDQRLEQMDAQRMDLQVLSGWTELLAYDLPIELAAEFAEKHNAALAAAQARHPGRFLGLATVPLQDPGRAADVLARALELGLVGAQIGTHVAGANLDDPALEPFWTAAEQLGAFVLVHPAQEQVAGRARLRKYYFENLLGNPFETAVAGASLIFGGVLERHPSLAICLAHGGGFLPYQIGRLVRGHAAGRTVPCGLKEGVDTSFHRLYFDSILHSSSNLRHLISLVGADHVLLGSDYPFDMGEMDPLAAVRPLGLADHEVALVIGLNAQRLLPVQGAP
jgi:aminocarboxymuconate-semialdehyde decarboxylase